jgi:hypothetical protein
MKALIKADEKLEQTYNNGSGIGSKHPPLVLYLSPFRALHSAMRMRLGISSGYEHWVHHCHHQWDTTRRLINVIVAVDRFSIYGAQSCMMPISMKYLCATFFFYIQIWIMYGHGKGYGMVSRWHFFRM